MRSYSGRYLVLLKNLQESTYLRCDEYPTTLTSPIERFVRHSKQILNDSAFYFQGKSHLRVRGLRMFSVIFAQNVNDGREKNIDYWFKQRMVLHTTYSFKTAKNGDTYPITWRIQIVRQMVMKDSEDFILFKLIWILQGTNKSQSLMTCGSFWIIQVRKYLTTTNLSFLFAPRSRWWCSYRNVPNLFC